MKLILLILFFSQIAWASYQPLKGKGQSASTFSTIERLQAPQNQITVTGTNASLLETGYLNLLKNPGFEATAFSADWTKHASADLTSAIASGDIALGAKAASFDASAASQDLTSGSVAIPAGLYGNNAEASCRFKTSATDYLLQAYDGTNILASQTITATTSFTRQILNFIFPSSGNISLRILSSSNASNIFVDDCYVGPATNLSQVSQAKNNVMLGWSGTQTANHDADTQVTFSGGANVTKLEGFTHNGSGTFTSQINGDCLVNWAVRQQLTVDAAVERQHFSKVYKNGVVAVQAGDIPGLAGNNVNSGGVPNTVANENALGWTQVSAVISVSTNDTLSLYFYTANGNGANRTIDRARFDVSCLPSTSQQVLNSNQVPSYWSGYHDSTCAWARTNTAYGDFTADASCALVQRVSSNISCVATGSVLPAIACTFPKAGTYKVCAHTGAWNGTASQTGQLRLWDGTTTISSAQVTTTAFDFFPLCGLYNAASTTATFTIQGKVTSGTINLGIGDETINWAITDESQNTPAPVFIGSVTSNSNGAERLERASVSITGVVSQETGDWINGNCTNATPFVCTINNGIFSGTPVCMVSPNQTDAVVRTTATSSTSVSVNTADATFTPAQRAFNIVCMGPR